VLATLAPIVGWLMFAGFTLAGAIAVLWRIGTEIAAIILKILRVPPPIAVDDSDLIPWSSDEPVSGYQPRHRREPVTHPDEVAT
jgi:hypothetical protein